MDSGCAMYEGTCWSWWRIAGAAVIAERRRMGARGRLVVTAPTVSCGTTSWGTCVPRIAAGTGPEAGTTMSGFVLPSRWIGSLLFCLLCGGGRGRSPLVENTRFTGSQVVARSVFEHRGAPASEAPIRPLSRSWSGLAVGNEPASTVASPAGCALVDDMSEGEPGAPHRPRAGGDVPTRAVADSHRGPVSAPSEVSDADSALMAGRDATLAH